MTHESENPSTYNGSTYNGAKNHNGAKDTFQDASQDAQPSTSNGLAIAPSLPSSSNSSSSNSSTALQSLNSSGFSPNSRELSPNGLNFASLGAQREFEPRVAKLEAEMDVARSQGVFGLLRLRYEAWLEERMMGPAIRKMQARQAIMDQQCKTAEVEIRLKATVQSGEVGAQRQRIEWNEINRQRLASELQSLGMIQLAPAPPAAAFPSAPPPVTPHVTDEQVEAVALRGLLQGVETEEEWQEYKSELSRHLSPYAVEEVGQRLRELWRLNRQAQAT